MPDIREEFEDRFPVPEGIEWRNTDYFPMQTENVHVYVALAGVAARYTSMWEAWKASRAALRVELPDKAKFVEYYEDLEGGTFNWQRYMVAIQEAL
ncbi:TPA: hypothetical protein ACHSVW_006103, partial [Pseudomonas aeruginosa]